MGILKVGHVTLVTPLLSPNSEFLYSSISLIVWSSFVKYAETLSVGLSCRFSPKSGFGGTWRTEIFWISPITIGNHISWESTLVASLVNVGGRLRSVERSPRFVWQTHSLTDTQTGFIICPMLPTRWADNYEHCCISVPDELIVVDITNWNNI